MARIIGELETWETLKRKVNIYKEWAFEDLDSIQNFKVNYQFHRNSILDNSKKIVVQKFENSKKQLESSTRKRQNNEDFLLNFRNKKEEEVKKSGDEIFKRNNPSSIQKLESFLVRQSKYFSNFFKNLSIKWEVANLDKKINRDSRYVYDFETNREMLIENEAKYDLRKLDKVHGIINNLNLEIAGLIGEKAVLNELSKLPDNYTIINNFNIKFKKPLYHKRTDSYIKSVQIDHLIVCASGIFVIETKNWSLDSLENENLFSPVNQVQRHGYAIFRMVSENFNFRDNWSKKKIPIRNILTFKTYGPMSKYEFVAIKHPKELNRYITYFKPVLKTTEIEKLVSYFSKYR